jgi:AcrR family transcriptional regulator
MPFTPPKADKLTPLGVHHMPNSRPKGHRSALTRAHIVATTITQLAQFGVSGAGNTAIAEAAGITRGNLLYHFPDRLGLLSDVAAQIQALRLDALKKEALNLPFKADPIDWAIDTYWDLVQTEPFLAFRALESEARYDKDVKLIIWPHQDGFDKAFLGQTTSWLWAAGREPRFQAGRDLARFCLEGLSHGLMTFEALERREQLKVLLKRTLRHLNHKSPQKPLWED